MEEVIKIETEELKEGTILDRKNRFIVRGEIDSKKKEIYLPNSGELSTVLSPGRKILSRKVKKASRKTKFTALAIEISDFFVTVDSRLANEIFKEIIKRSLISKFKKTEIAEEEPSFPEHGRADFLLKQKENETDLYVEVKSCTHVENGTAKFPDRPTKRGRRHLKSLMKLAQEGDEATMIFVVQRPDAKEFRPFKKIDPQFSNLLQKARKTGVQLHALTTEFNPPKLFLKRKKIPIKLNKSKT
ncbi:MAG: DNA/RNA nuclease SfsA [Candidatus Hadarchaeia archaeon]